MPAPLFSLASPAEAAKYRRKPGTGMRGFTPTVQPDIFTTLPGHMWGIDGDFVSTSLTAYLPPTANGQTIARGFDTSGNNRDVTQTTAGSRPLWSRINGRGAYGSQSGTNRFMASTSFLNASFDRSFTLYWVGERGQSAATTLAAAISLPSTSNGVFIGADRTTAPLERIDAFTQNLASNSDRYRTFDDASTLAVVMRYNGRKKSIRVYAPNYDQTTEYLVTGAMGLNGTIRIFESVAAGNRWVGTMFGASLHNVCHSDGEVEQALAYIRKRWMQDPIPTGFSVGSGTKNVLCDGNSLTAGVGETEWPEQLATSLGAGYNVTNQARGSFTTGMMNIDAEERVDDNFDPDAEKNILVFWEGSNDLFFNGTELATERRMRDYILRRKAKGWYVINCTIIPRNGVSTPAGFDTLRLAVNTWINAGSSGAHAIADLAAVANLSDPNDTTYFNADKVHLTTAGAAEVEAVVEPLVTAA